MSREVEISGSETGTDWIDVEGLALLAGRGGIVGRSPATGAMIAAIERFAPYPGTVLVTGESGTGKELVTRALHQLGPSPSGPLVSFNCSNLVEGLAESQLFGHVKGAFTDAREAHIGCFRQANSGTLVLDEVGELPLGMQSKLLRVTESGEIQPVGSAATIQLTVRMIAATNRDLRAMVKAGEFRADLYYRLDVASIRVPALRDRIEDVAPLAAHFVGHYNRAFGKQIRLIARRVIDLFHAYRWPGNVRELAHVIERAVLLSENDRIDLVDLAEEFIQAATADHSFSAASQASDDAVRSRPLDDVLKDTLQRSLIEAQGDCARAAQLLGISRPAIYRKMVRFGISHTWFRQYRRPAESHRAKLAAGPGEIPISRASEPPVGLPDSYDSSR
jgi:transcriptional regulator with GAF, ATPase, and Fis domain